MKNTKAITLNYLLVCCFTFFSLYLTAQNLPSSDVIFRIQNVETGQYLTAGGGSSQPVTMSAAGDAQNTHWTFVESGAYHNIDSESETGGTGILRAPGAGGPGGAYVVVSTLKAPPASDTDKTWTIHYNATTDKYRFESLTSGRFLYHEANNTITHIIASDTDDRSNWELIPILTAPDEDTNPDLTCPASGEFQNDNTRDVDITNPVNVGTADDRTCYSDYSESSVYGQTWGVYNITDGSNHWDAPNTLQPRIERSLPRSTETGVGSYARFTGTLRILEAGDAAGTNDDGTYLMQAKGKHTGGGGPADPAICLYLAKPIYGDDGTGNQVQVSFDIYREQINYRGGSGADGRTIVFLRNVVKNELVDIELEVGFRADPNDPNLKIHYADAVIGGQAFNWDIPEPERGTESGIRYGAYRVKGGRAQMRWANTTYEKNEVVDAGPNTIRLQNCATGEFLTAGGSGGQAVTMSATGNALNTQWTLVESGTSFNIDSASETGGTGVLRAPGAGGPGGAYVIVSTTATPPNSDSDKMWTVHYDAANDTYRFESQTSSSPNSGRFLYQETDGTVTHTAVPASDTRSVWKNATTNAVLPLDFVSFEGQSMKTGTQLNWKIANEINNDYFEILKGDDINEFQSIGRVANEPGQEYYQFLDRQIDSQTSYYKIKQIDFDGKFSFSDIISVKSNFAPIVLYPNPVGQNEAFTIESQQGYQIFDLKGMLLKSGTEKTIKMDLEKGVYFLKQNNSSQVERFIVY
jgi:hypothetical protein